MVTEIVYLLVQLSDRYGPSLLKINLEIAVHINGTEPTG